MPKRHTDPLPFQNRHTLLTINAEIRRAFSSFDYNLVSLVNHLSSTAFNRFSMSDFWLGVVFEIALFPLELNPEDTVAELLTIEACLPSRRSSSKAEISQTIQIFKITKAAQVATNTTDKKMTKREHANRSEKHFPLIFFSDLPWSILWLRKTNHCFRYKSLFWLRNVKWSIIDLPTSSTLSRAFGP